MKIKQRMRVNVHFDGVLDAKEIFLDLIAGQADIDTDENEVDNENVIYYNRDEEFYSECPGMCG